MGNLNEKLLGVDKPLKWEIGKQYNVDDIVHSQEPNVTIDKIYRCVTVHVSAGLLADIANWVELSGPNLVDGSGDGAMESNNITLAADADAAGINSIAIGNNATTDALATSGLSIGTSSEANGVNSVALGTDAVATGNNSVALGRDTVSLQDSVAIGFGSTNTSGTESIALGITATSSQSRAISIGYASDVTGDSSIAIGVDATSGAANAIAVGHDSSSQFEGVAVGFGAQNFAGTRGVAIGADASSNLTRAIAIGDSASAGGTAGIAIGALSVSAVSDGVAIGKSTSALQGSVAIGLLAVNTGGLNTIAIGQAASTSQNRAIAIGDSASAAGSESMALGYLASVPALMTNSTAIGTGATVDAANQIMIGTAAQNIVMPGNGTPALDRVPTGIDATGNWTWQDNFAGWVVSVQAANYSPVPDEEIYVNTAGGPITITLPDYSAFTGGERIRIVDYNNTWFTSDNVTIAAFAAQDIDNILADAGSGGEIIGDVDNDWVELVFVDTTVGWRSKNA